MRSFAISLLLLAAPWAAAQSTVYFSDFEADDGGWSATGDWQRGTPAATPDRSACFSQTSPFPTGAASGVTVWGTNLAGCHAASQDAQLTRTFDLSAVSGAIQMCWNQFIDTGGNTFDMASVEVNGAQQYLSSGSSGAVYENVCIPLTAFAGQASVAVAFRLLTSTVVERAGWYVDDVQIASGVVASSPTPQVGLSLSGVRPNPLRGRGQVTLAVDQTQTIAVEIVNVLGQRVATVFEGPAVAGQPLVLAVDASALPAGVYVVRVTGATARGAVRMTVQ